MAHPNNRYMVPRVANSIAVLWKMMKTKTSEVNWVMSSCVSNPNRNRKHVGFTMKTYQGCQWLGHHFAISLFHAGSSITHLSTVCGSLPMQSMLHMSKNFGTKLFWRSHALLPFMVTQYLLWYVRCSVWHPCLHISRSGNRPMTGRVTLQHVHKKQSKLFLIAMSALWLLQTELTMWSGQYLKSHKSSIPTVTTYLLLLHYFRICGHLLTMAWCHAPNVFGTVDIEIMSPAFQKLKSFFKNIFISLEHLKLRKRKIADIIPHVGYYKFKNNSDANDMTVQQYYCKTYNIHIK